MSARSLLTWNILTGLLDTEADYPAVAKDRRDAAVALVERFKPDVLVLNEALYAEEYGGYTQDYAALFGFPYSVAQLYDGAWGNAILSRYPVTERIRAFIHPAGSAQNRGALAARVSLPEGDVWIATFHPHPHRRAFKRADDLDAFLSRLTGPTVLAGDLNAISPEDKIDRGVLLRGFAKFSAPGDAENAVGRFLDAGRIIFSDVFPRFGMRDAVPVDKRQPTMPTSLLSNDQESAIRIDHIVVSPGIEVLDGGTRRDALADVASDHYPVFIEFALPS